MALITVVILLVYGAVSTCVAPEDVKVSRTLRFRRQAVDAEAGCTLPPPQQNGKFAPSKTRCPPDKTYSVHSLCRMTPGNLVPHNWPLFHSCDLGYALNATNPASVCLNGQWRPPLPSCVLFGVHQGSTEPLVPCGNKTQQGEFPWAAALYYLDNEENIWEQKCSGTLITPHIVLTAALCLVDPQSLEVRQTSDIKVGLGKHYRDFYKNKTSSVISDVKELIVRKEYMGPATNFAFDIGLVDLVKSVKLTDSITPACVDWSKAFRPDAGAVATVVGWGRTSDGTTSDVILSAQQNITEYIDCIKMLSASEKRLVAHDKICGKLSSGGIQVGKFERAYSGEGLTVENKNGQSLLVGILSESLKEEANPILLFTDIHIHSEWLEDKSAQLKAAHQEPLL